MLQARTLRSALTEFKARPEHEVLLLCGRAVLEPSQAARLRSLAGSGLDAEYLLSTAHRHRMLPLLWRHLSETCPESLPPGIMSEIGRRCQDHVRFSLTAARELLRILAEFQRNGVPALPFKGPVLSQWAYRDPALRQFFDLDLFVHPRDALRAKSVLEGMGFPYRWSSSSVREAAILRSAACREYHVLSGGPVLDLELHWALFPPMFQVKFNPDDLFRCSQAVLLGGTEVRTFGTEDLLLFLCAHSGKHLFDCLLWMVDIAEILRSKEVDWDNLFRRANRLGIRRILSACLLLAVRLLDAPLPDEVRARLEGEKAAEPLASHALGASFRAASDEQSIPVKFRFRFSSRERWRNRLGDGFGFLAGLFTPTPFEWDAVPLPDRLFFLYYLFRPVRLAGKYGRRLWTRPEAS